MRLPRGDADPYEETVTEPLPLDRSQPLRGRDLRHACLVVLSRSQAIAGLHRRRKRGHKGSLDRLR